MLAEGWGRQDTEGDSSSSKDTGKIPSFCGQLLLPADQTCTGGRDGWESLALGGARVTGGELLRLQRLSGDCEAWLSPCGSTGKSPEQTTAFL